MRPTAEQEAICDVAKQGGSLVVKAFAGTGKTTTLTLLSEVHPAPTITYLAFNKAIADEASGRMSKKVSGRTMHSLAFRGMRPDTNRLNTKITGDWVANRFSLSGMGIGYDKKITSTMMGTLALLTVQRFCNSADDELMLKHVPGLRSIFSEVPEDVRADVAAQAAMREYAIIAAKKLWIEQTTPGHSTPITHDIYLKEWALRQPMIPTDLIMFDEAQDASPVFLKLLSEQRAPVVWVGDAHQQIYAWRGAVNALDNVNTPNECYLTQSFRFGDNIADPANIILKLLGETRPLIGSGNGRPSNGREAILCRTNMAALGSFMETPKGLNVELVGAEQMATTVRQLGELKKGNPTGEFALFQDYAELREYSDSDAGSDVRTVVKAVDAHGVEPLLARLSKASSRHVKNADLTISTCHRAKGREWDYVTIDNDWAYNPKSDDIMSDDELRLLYVALTRGRVEVDTHEITKLMDLLTKRSLQMAAPSLSL